MMSVAYISSWRLRIIECRWCLSLVAIVVAGWTFAKLAAAPGEDAAQPMGLVQRVEVGVVQRGMVIPYFGKDLPPGYRWCAGNDKALFPKEDNVFPRADWVPEHLKGQPLPDLRQQFVGGAAGVGVKDEKDVGTIWSEGKLECVVKGESFQLAPKDVTELPEMMRWQWGPHTPISFRCQLKERRGEETWGGLHLVTAVFLKNTTTNLQGSQSVTLLLDKPEHKPAYMICRWIIRVE